MKDVERIRASSLNLEQRRVTDGIVEFGRGATVGKMVSLVLDMCVGIVRGKLAWGCQQPEVRGSIHGTNLRGELVSCNCCKNYPRGLKQYTFIVLKL